MIRIVSKSYQTDTVKVTIEFDVASETYSRDVEAQITQVLGMTVEEIRAWVVGFVTNQRAALQRQALDVLLDPLIGVDLEG